MKPKFGRVFIEEQETTSKGENVVVSKLLDGVRFSNTDHKWYDSEGNLSPLYESYKGRPIFLRFKINLKDVHEKDVEFETKVILPFLLGELKPQDLESVERAEKEMKDYWKTIGMLSKDVDNKAMHDALLANQGARFVACLCPGSKISEMKTLHACFDPYFALDEFIEEKHMDFKLTNLYASALSTIVSGKWEGDEKKNLKTELANLPEKFSKLLLGIQGFRDAIVENGGNPEQVIRSYEEFHDALALETCGEWKKIREDPTSIIFEAFRDELRTFSTASYTALEMILFDRKIQVDKKVRESFLFRNLCRTYVKHGVAVNDLLSIKKEMEFFGSSPSTSDGPENSIFVLHARKGLTLKDALQKIVDKIAWLTRVIHEAGELFVNLYGDHVEALTVVDSIKGIMHGNLQWGTSNERYLPNVVCDCVVGLK